MPYLSVSRNSRSTVLPFVWAWAIAVNLAGMSAADEIDFNRQVAPILVQHCLECHNEHEAAGDLVLTTADRVFAGGSSGPAIVPSQPDESLLLERVSLDEMPPEKKGKSQQLPEAEIDVLRAWIEQGAKWPEGRVLDPYEQTTAARAGRDWWSLQPIRTVTPPTISPTANAANPIDAFILAKLDQHGMHAAPAADRRTLLRRITYDLTGLPPTPDEIAAFENDSSPTAFEQVVDRLLSSPHFGERWARHWLDVVRFAETSGYERDQEKPGAWRYRDWVVQALNTDKPYDQFVLEQLAGDELPERDEQTVTATGLLRLGTWNDEPNDPEEYKYERLEDLVHVTTSAFLASTAKCARCHDHKFDPIPQTDYYRIAAAFWPGPIAARDRELLGGPSKEELGFDVLGWTDLSANPTPLHLLRKGDPNHPLQVIDAGALSFIPTLNRSFQQPTENARTTQRRKQLADWIIDPQNPLTARVIVNRLWLHHFGQGLVRTPNDFGFNGDQPSHPELLDWLAGELVKSGWSLKHIHRLIVTSNTYAQSSLHPEELAYRQKDSANRLWWRAERRRLDAEQLRDSLLAAANQIDLRMGGPSFKPTVSQEALEGLSRKGSAWAASPRAEQRRRSLYIFSQRSLLAPMLTTFDFADTTLPCGQRDVTTVAPQALALLNNPLVHEQSEQLAERVLAQASSDDQQRVSLAWRYAIGREPTPAEIELSLTHLQVQGQKFAERAHIPTVPKYELPATDRLALHLSAEVGVDLDDDGRVARWLDQSGRNHHATQADSRHRPTIAVDSATAKPTMHFDGDRRYLHIASQIITRQQFTIAAVVTDRGGAEHRAILSNWNGGAGNSVTSVFLGLTRAQSVRLSDDLVGGEIQNRNQPFVLTAVSGAHDAWVLQNNVQILHKGTPLSERNITAPYVLGQQGTIDGEYWHGDIAELLVYDAELSGAELDELWSALGRRYDLLEPEKPREASFLALASLCHVLLNSNEFIYID